MTESDNKSQIGADRLKLLNTIKARFGEAIAADKNDEIRKYGGYLLAVGVLNEIAERTDPFTRHLLAPLRSMKREAALVTLLETAFHLDDEVRNLVVRVCADCLLEVGGPELLARKVRLVIGDSRARFVVVDREIGNLIDWKANR